MEPDVSTTTTRSATVPETGWPDDGNQPDGNRTPTQPDRPDDDARPPDDAGPDDTGPDDLGPDAAGSPTEAGSPSRPSRSRSRRAGAAELDRAAVRRVLERQAAVRSLAGSDLELVAGLLGVEAAVDAVTESSLVGGKAATATALRDLDQLAGSGSDMDALLAAIEMGPERIRALNTLVATLCGTTPTRLHASHAKAARQVVVAVRRLPEDVRGRVSGLTPLLC